MLWLLLCDILAYFGFSSNMIDVGVQRYFTGTHVGNGSKQRILNKQLYYMISFFGIWSNSWSANKNLTWVGLLYWSMFPLSYNLTSTFETSSLNCICCTSCVPFFSWLCCVRCMWLYIFAIMEWRCCYLALDVWFVYVLGFESFGPLGSF